MILGWADAIAPAGAWVGVTGTLEPQAVLLAGAVAFWVGGFDIIYACMDFKFDKEYGIHSIPRRFGIAGALWIARLMHVVTSGSLLALGIWMELGVFYFVGWGIASAMLVYQNSLVKPTDLSRVPVAALKFNSYVGADSIAGYVIGGVHVNPVVVGISGASGSVIAQQVVEALLTREVPTALVCSKRGQDGVAGGDAGALQQLSFGRGGRARSLRLTGSTR